MATPSTPGLFITGTDTGVGKTYVACCIARNLRAAGRRVGVYKPVASGCEQRDGQLVAGDAVALWRAAGQPHPREDLRGLQGDVSSPSAAIRPDFAWREGGASDRALEFVCPQRFAAPLAPPLAARAEGRELDAGLLRSGLDCWRGRCDIVLVEGAGGLMSPLSDEDYVADLALEFGLPLIVVAPNQLGAINQALQTLITAATFRDGLDVAGLVLNDLGRSAEQDPSIATNRAELEARCVPPVLAQLRWGADTFDESVDWFALARG